MFTTSSQAREWTWKSEQDLEILRQESRASTSLTSLLTIPEELLLLRHFEFRLQSLCTEFNIPEKNECTILNRVCVDAIQDLLFVPCEVGVEPSALLDFELILLSGLRFHLTVFQPQRSLYGFLLDWFNVMKDASQLPPPEISVDSLMVEARQAIRAIMTTDAPLLFTPGQIALAVMQHVVASRLSIDPSLQTKLERYVQSKLATSPAHANLATVMDKLNVLLISGKIPPEATTVSSVIAKLPKAI